MSTVQATESQFGVIITPLIAYVEGPEAAVRDKPSASAAVPKSEAQVTKIDLKYEWAIVAAHPKFQVDYKDFIRTCPMHFLLSNAAGLIVGRELGVEIDVNGEEVTCVGDVIPLTRSTTSAATLGVKTNNFMQRFKFQKLHNVKPFHMKTLHAHSDRIAFSRLVENEVTVAGSAQDITEVKYLLFPWTNPANKPHPPKPTTPPPRSNNQ